jgi:hypothetical protein
VVAIKKVDKVPTITPIDMTREKPNIEDPPNKTRARRTTKVVPEVRMVRLRVILRA